MSMPSPQEAEDIRAAIDQGGLKDKFDPQIEEMLGGLTHNDDILPIAKDFLEVLRKADRTFEAGDAAACVLLGARKEAKEALEDAGFSARQAKSLIALGLSILGPVEHEVTTVLAPEDWMKEVPDQGDDEEEDEDACGEEGCGHSTARHPIRGGDERAPTPCLDCSCQDFVEPDESGDDEDDDEDERDEEE